MKRIIKYNTAIIIVSLIIALINTVQPLLLKNIIDSLSLKLFDSSKSYILIYLLVTIIVLFIEYIHKVLYIKFDRFLHTFFRKNMTDNILNLKKTQFSSIDNKEYFSIYNNEISEIINNYYLLIPSLIFQIFSFIFYTAALFYLDFKIAIIILLFNILATAMPYIFEKKLQYYQDLNFKKLRLFNIAIDDLLSGFNTMKEYKYENTIKSNILNISDEQQKYSYKNSLLSSKIDIIIGVLFFGYYILILFLGTINISTTTMTVGDLVAIIGLADLIVNPIMLISNYLVTFLGNKNKNKELVEEFKILTPPKKVEKELSENNVEEIEFKDVLLQFDDKIILNKFNMKFEKNKKYLILGPNGSGKSSILKIIFKDIENYNGNVSINNKYIKNLDDDYYNEYFSYIPQNPYMFNGSILNNIVLDESYDKNDIFKIIDTLNLKDNFVFNNDRYINNSKNIISGGEKQKLAIARALFYDKKVIVFDEAMSQIDSISGKKIENHILSMEKVLFINIAHHINKDLIDKYDTIIQLNYNGKYEIIDI